jgi:hypothetical protein
MRTCIFLVASLSLFACTGVDGDGDGAEPLADPQSSARFDVLSRAPISEASDLMYNLPSANLTLQQGIDQAATDGFPISAKFEMSDDGSSLSLSVYTARGGVDTIPEANELAELAGDPTGVSWQPGAEVFSDYEHIARASEHLTLMSIAGVTLDQVFRAAAAEGDVYRVEPTVIDGRPAFEVLIATDDGDAEQLELAVH